MAHEYTIDMPISVGQTPMIPIISTSQQHILMIAQTGNACLQLAKCRLIKKYTAKKQRGTHFESNHK